MKLLISACLHSSYTLEQAEELASRIAAIVAAGKPVTAYVPHLGDMEMMVASRCSRIIVPPSGEVALRGLAGSTLFLRSALDKLGLEPEVRAPRTFISICFLNGCWFVLILRHRCSVLGLSKVWRTRFVSARCPKQCAHNSLSFLRVRKQSWLMELPRCGLKWARIRQLTCIHRVDPRPPSKYRLSSSPRGCRSSSKMAGGLTK
jgi:hypothetical protein